jgi:hypothetical protein
MDSAAEEIRVRQACDGLDVDDSIISYIAAVLHDKPSEADLVSVLSAFIPINAKSVAKKLVVTAPAPFIAPVPTTRTKIPESNVISKTQHAVGEESTKTAGGQEFNELQTVAMTQSERRNLRKNRQAQARLKTKQFRGSDSQEGVKKDTSPSFEAKKEKDPSLAKCNETVPTIGKN